MLSPGDKKRRAGKKVGRYRFSSEASEWGGPHLDFNDRVTCLNVSESRAFRRRSQIGKRFSAIFVRVFSIRKISPAISTWKKIRAITQPERGYAEHDGEGHSSASREPCKSGGRALGPRAGLMPASRIRTWSSKRSRHGVALYLRGDSRKIRYGVVDLVSPRL